MIEKSGSCVLQAFSYQLGLASFFNVALGISLHHRFIQKIFTMASRLLDFAPACVATACGLVDLLHLTPWPLTWAEVTWRWWRRAPPCRDPSRGLRRGRRGTRRTGWRTPPVGPLLRTWTSALEISVETKFEKNLNWTSRRGPGRVYTNSVSRKSRQKMMQMTQTYTCSWTKVGHSLKYSSFVMLLEAPQAWRTKRYEILETDTPFIVTKNAAQPQLGRAVSSPCPLSI